MSDRNDRPAPGAVFWIVGVVALLWNIMGVFAFYMTAAMSPEALAALPEAEQALYGNIPAWVTAAYAVAVFGGTLGCVLLLMRKASAVTLFAASLAAVLLQMGHALFATALLEVQGPGGAAMPLLIVVIAAYLVWYAMAAKKKEWLG